jgi:hypothetical protein
MFIFNDNVPGVQARVGREREGGRDSEQERGSDRGRERGIIGGRVAPSR